MNNQKVTVTARIKVKSGLEDKFKQEYLPIVKLTLEEKGCINYNLHQSQNEPSVFMLYENWESKEVLDQHLQMDYMKAISEKASEFLAEPVEMNLWEPVS